jgi:hypothetical protein
VKRVTPKLLCWCAALLLGGALSAQNEPAAPEPPPRLEAFTLSDQFERAHSIAFPRERPLLLTVADRKGATQVHGWVAPMRERFGARLDQTGVADVSKVPGFLRSRVRAGFREEYTHPVLLDWQGRVCRAVKAERGQATVLLVTRTGEIVFRAGGAVAPDVLERLSRAVEETLAAPSKTEPAAPAVPPSAPAAGGD